MRSTKDLRIPEARCGDVNNMARQLLQGLGGSYGKGKRCFPDAAPDSLDKAGPAHDHLNVKPVETD